MIAGLILVVGGQVAEAGPPSLVRVSDGGNGTATASCPNNTVLYGVGGDVTSGGAEPEIELTEDRVAGTATAEVNGNDSLTAYAICGPVGSPVLTEDNELGGVRQTSMQIGCDPGSHVYGAQAEIVPSGTGVVVTGIVPGPGLKVVTFNADDSQAVGNARWNISATIQCG
ncbi:hypothetical protein JOF56_011203 [Kibdelosporangium banguiense]|uniref:Uncharacterized protein n=1 Tax=Kibdelosporangium banguiense TaxID=1365924 RepID=A0ABS4U3P5_9PSEU|nr:hypothetical protein [Kibdelosporangium banguiense]MBP2330818.1 hypothetical protein [Kibdelosporangium banguiense]